MKNVKKYFLAALVALCTLSVNAQQVNTLYFLENAPMRHTINPAFMPVSAGYVNFSPLGWMSLSFGNNSLTLSDALYTIEDPNNPGKYITVTPLYPSSDPTNSTARKDRFLRQIRNMLYVNGDVNFSIVNIGIRVKDFGYGTFGVNEHIETGFTFPKSMFNFFLNGGMANLDGGMNTLGLSGLGIGATA